MNQTDYHGFSPILKIVDSPARKMPGRHRGAWQSIEPKDPCDRPPIRSLFKPLVLRLLSESLRNTRSKKTPSAIHSPYAGDLERSCLRLTDSKTGAKVIPLGPPALAILSELTPVEDSLFVFPAESGGGAFQGTEKVWRKVRTAANLKDVRIHDLRHSFASAGLAGGDALPIIGKLLGHADVKTTARYAHLADDPVKAAASRISGSIAAAMDSRPLAEIVPLKR